MPQHSDFAQFGHRVYCRSRWSTGASDEVFRRHRRTEVRAADQGLGPIGLNSHWRGEGGGIHGPVDPRRWASERWGYSRRYSKQGVGDAQICWGEAFCTVSHGIKREEVEACGMTQEHMQGSRIHFILDLGLKLEVVGEACAKLVLGGLQQRCFRAA